MDKHAEILERLVSYFRGLPRDEQEDVLLALTNVVYPPQVTIEQVQEYLRKLS